MCVCGCVCGHACTQAHRSPESVQLNQYIFDFCDFTEDQTELVVACLPKSEQTTVHNACVLSVGDSPTNSGLLSCVGTKTWPPPHQGLNFGLLTVNSKSEFCYRCLIKRHWCGCRTCNISKFLSVQLLLQDCRLPTCISSITTKRIRYDDSGTVQDVSCTVVSPFKQQPGSYKIKKGLCCWQNCCFSFVSPFPEDI